MVSIPNKARDSAQTLREIATSERACLYADPPRHRLVVAVLPKQQDIVAVESESLESSLHEIGIPVSSMDTVLKTMKSENIDLAALPACNASQMALPLLEPPSVMPFLYPRTLFT